MVCQRKYYLKNDECLVAIKIYRLTDLLGIKIEVEQGDPELRKIWKQQTITVVFRQPRPNPLLVRLPYAKNNLEWLRGENRKNRSGITNANVGKRRYLGSMD